MAEYTISKIKLPNGDICNIKDTNTWRGIQDNLTSSSNTTESLSAKQGYLLANGSARDNTKVPTSMLQVTTSTSVGLEPTTNTFGFVNGLTKANWNYQQIDGILYTQFYNASWKHQIFGDYRTGQISIRGKNNGTWQNWRRVLDETNARTLLGVTDNSNNADVTSSDTNLITARTLYYQLAKKGYTTNTGTVTSVATSGSGGITISGSPITTSGTIAIGLNLSTAINGLGEGSSQATGEDYLVAQYAGGGTTTTTYHRRKVSNVVNATVVKAALSTNSTHSNQFLRKDGTWQTPPYPVTSVAGNTGAITAETLRESLGLSQALRFRGKTTTDMSDGFTGTPAISGVTYTPTVGDVVLDSSSDSEYVCISVSGTTYTWERLGRDSSWALDNAVIHNTLVTTKGDIIYASGPNTPARLAIGTGTNKFLTVSNGVPAWGAVAKSDVGLSNVTNDAQIPKSVFTEAYQILYSTGSNAYAVLTANKSTIKKFLSMTGASSSAGAAPVWDTVTSTDVGLGNVSNNSNLNNTTGSKGDIIYWSSANTPAHLTNTNSTTKQALTITSQVPAWTNISPSISITAGDASNAPKINVNVLGVSGTAQSITTASTSVYGVTKLNDGIASNSTALAATANSALVAAKKVASSNNTSRLYLVGATSQSTTGVDSYSYQYTYTNNGLLSALKLGLNLNGTEKAHLEWNNTDQSIDFIFE